MQPSLLRSALGSITSQLKPVPTRIRAQSSSGFASSSRVKLDSTSSVWADQTRSTTTTTTTTILEDSPQPSSRPDSAPSSGSAPSPDSTSSPAQPQAKTPTQAKSTATTSQTSTIGNLTRPAPPHQSPASSTTPTSTTPKQIPRFNVPTSPTTSIPLPTSSRLSTTNSNSRFTPSPSSSSSTGVNLRYNPESSASDHTAPTHTLTVKSTRNNLLLTFSDNLGPLWGTITSGSNKVFKKSQRNTYEAANQASLKMFDKILTYARSVRSGAGTGDGQGPVKMRVAFKGLQGQGREAVAAVLSGPEGVEVRSLIRRVEDRTVVKIGGTRAPKKRRI